GADWNGTRLRLPAHTVQPFTMCPLSWRKNSATWKLKTAGFTTILSTYRGNTSSSHGSRANHTWRFWTSERVTRHFLANSCATFISQLLPITGTELPARILTS